MKLKYIIGILALLLLMVGTASAEEQTQTVTLTEEDSNLEVFENKDVLDGLLQVTVTYDPNIGVITYKYTGRTKFDGVHPYVTAPKIDQIAYNLERPGTVLDALNSPLGWTDPTRGNNKISNFDDFDHHYSPSTANDDRYSTVKVQLDSVTGEQFPRFSSTGYAVGLHLAFREAHYANGSIYELPPDITIIGEGSTFLAGGVDEIPEFPTVALPVAAILGLMFIFGRKKEE